MLTTKAHKAMMTAMLAGAAACAGTVIPNHVDEGSPSAGAGASGAATVANSGTGTGTTTGSGAGPGLVAHEWGTYTSVQSSAGVTMDGMAHEDEALPAFVHGRAALGESECNAKQLEYCPTGVTQKLETPVIYFYGDASSVRVKVDFPKGIISQWYPAAESFAPAVDPNKNGTPAAGSMTWFADLLPSLGDADFPAVAPTDIWAPSRHVGSLPLRLAGKQTPEQERFIFYRGLGAFDMPFHVTANGDTQAVLHNDSPDKIAAAYVLHVTDQGGWVKAVGPIAANGTLPVELLSKYLDLNSLVAVAKDSVKEGLVQSGLTDEESQAMVDTWERSYFKIPGTRVLYVAPRSWTDALLPIHIDPQPKDLVRTLVGRVEIMSPAEEKAVVGLIQSYGAGKISVDAALKTLGRFAEPKLRRGAQLVAGTSDATAAKSLVSYAQWQH